MSKSVLFIALAWLMLSSSPLFAQQSCMDAFFAEHPNLLCTDTSYSAAEHDEFVKTVIARQEMAMHRNYPGLSASSASPKLASQPCFLAIDTVNGRAQILAQDGTYLADVHIALVDSTWYMWLSVDPLADKNISTTPYGYCNGNPVMLVDPDGRDEWDLDLQGHVVKYTKNEEADIIRYVDKNGLTRTDKNGKPMEIKYAFGSFSVSTNDDVTIVSAGGDDVGQGIFEFLVQSGIVTEWTLLQTGADSEGNNYISTSHQRTSDNSFLKIPEIYPFTQLRSQIHNHPGNNNSPSGLEDRIKSGVLQGAGKWGDMQVKSIQQKRWGNLVMFKIYLPGTDTYILF